MLFRNLLYVFTLLTLDFVQAQRTKTDTVYVYEKVIVYDTIYLEKAIKRYFKDVNISKPILKEPIIKNHTFKIENENELRKKVALSKFHYGIEAGIGFKNSSWANEITNKQQFGQNLGIWASKNIVPNLSLLLSANVYHWNSTFDLDANKEDTFLNGFYFTEDDKPLLFQRFNNKHFEYTAQLKLIYKWKNIRPFVGFLANQNRYKMQFLVPENSILNKLDDFKSKQINYGFSFGIQYRVFTRFLIIIDYQKYLLKNLSLKNSSFDFDIFKTNNTFAERKINLGISYFISK